MSKALTPDNRLHITYFGGWSHTLNSRNWWSRCNWWFLHNKATVITELSWRPTK